MVEPSYPGDACCPACGHLLWWFRDRLGGAAALTAIDLDSSLDSLGVDSLEIVEIVMELEEEFDVNITDEDAAQFRSIEDAIRYLRHRCSDDAA